MIAGDVVQMSLSLAINCADLKALAQAELGDRRLVPSPPRGGGAGTVEVAWSLHGFSDAKRIASASKFPAPILAR
jgi:hypothetical protein